MTNRTNESMAHETISANSEQSDELSDERWMRRALELARRGQGAVEPNPMVGCVLVRDGQLLAEGYHRKFGGPHAERDAIATATERGIGLAGATAYVTLEPCCHYGKTPPCTDALIASKIARVCCAMEDPFAQVHGQGAKLLRAAGIQVDVGLLERDARDLNAPYLKRVMRGLPWIIAKWAMSLDGKIATRTGNSRWISSEESRRTAHELRGRMDAIIVGSGTALTDDPLLTVRPAGLRQPLRVVVDSELKLPLASQLVQTAREVPVLIWSGTAADAGQATRLRGAGCTVVMSPEASKSERLYSLLKYLGGDRACSNVLVEGGAGLLGSLFDEKWMDECIVYIAPKLIGGAGAPSPLAQLGVANVGEGPEVRVFERQQFGPDCFLRGRLEWGL